MRDEVFILPCDTPFVSEELIAYVAAFPTNAPARIAAMNGRLHPLCGVYSRACLPTIEEALAAQRYSLHEVLTRLGATVVVLSPELPFYDERLLLNVNDPAALAALDPEPQ